MEIERAFLANLITGGLKEARKVKEIIKVDDFVVEMHQEIYQAIAKFVEDNKPFDAPLLIDHLRSHSRLANIDTPVRYSKVILDILEWDVNQSLQGEYIEKFYEQRLRKQISVVIEGLPDNFDKIDPADFFKKIDDIKKEVKGISEFVKLSDIISKVLDSIEKQEGVEFQFSLMDLNHSLAGLARGELLLIGGFTSQGKCLGKGTRIVMYSGKLKKVEDIKMGDLLMGIDSTPREVMDLYSGKDDLYIIKQYRGLDYTVNSKHILALKKSDYAKKKHFRKDRGYSDFKYPSYSDVVNIPINEYVLKRDGFKKHFKGYKVGIEFSLKKIDIDPYFLGLWLGDGTVSSQNITALNDKIINYIKQYANKLGMKVGFWRKNGTEAKVYRVKNKKGNKNKLLEWLRSYDLINNKHIPDDYLYNTKEIRLKLLAGLIDTDGYKNCNGYEITQKNKKLAYQVYYLASSLGFRCSINKTIKTIKSINFKGLYYKVGIIGDVKNIPVLVEYKKIKIDKQTRDPLTTGIKVEHNGEGEYVGFTLDGDGLFLLEDFTVLHNSSLCIQMAMDFAEQGKKVLFCSSEMSEFETARRVLGNYCSLVISDLRQGKLDIDISELREVVDTLKSWKVVLHIISTAEQVRPALLRYQPDIVIVDHLHNLRGPGRSPYEKTTNNIKTLQEIALINRVGMIVASQLHRPQDEKLRPPRISDLRESGAIEETANSIILLYWKNQRENGKISEQEIMEVRLVKNRDGKIGKLSILFEPLYCRFRDIFKGEIPNGQ